jgi:hypothetical protein
VHPLLSAVAAFTTATCIHDFINALIAHALLHRTARLCCVTFSHGKICLFATMLLWGKCAIFLHGGVPRAHCERISGASENIALVRQTRQKREAHTKHTQSKTADLQVPSIVVVNFSL